MPRSRPSIGDTTWRSDCRMRRNLACIRYPGCSKGTVARSSWSELRSRCSTRSRLPESCNAGSIGRSGPYRYPKDSRKCQLGLMRSMITDTPGDNFDDQKTVQDQVKEAQAHSLPDCLGVESQAGGTGSGQRHREGGRSRRRRPTRGRGTRPHRTTPAAWHASTCGLPITIRNDRPWCTKGNDFSAGTADVIAT